MRAPAIRAETHAVTSTNNAIMAAGELPNTAALEAAPLLSFAPNLATPVSTKPRARSAKHHAAAPAESLLRTATAHHARKSSTHEHALKDVASPSALTDGASKEPPAPTRATAIATSTTSAPGTLRINSRPWSQVFVDGRMMGNTPQMAMDVQPGSHNVRLVNAEFSMSKTFQVEVHSGETVTHIEMLKE